MAKIISSPWIFPTIQELLREVNDNNNVGMMHSNIRPKVVQTLNVVAEERILVVSDQHHSVAVFLTDDCIEDFEATSNNRQLKTLRHSLIKLEKWHVSTTIQCAGNRDIASLRTHNITLPIAIQCGKITCLEANDSVVIGDPIDINRDTDLRAILSRLSYITMSSRFSERQFPHDRMLPDSTGLLCIPRQYTKEYPLRPHHCQIPVGQQLEIDQLKHAMHLLSQHGSQRDGTLIEHTQYDDTLLDDGMLDVDLCGVESQGGYAQMDMLFSPPRVINISNRIQYTPQAAPSTPQRTSAEHTLVDSTQNTSIDMKSPVQWLTQPLNEDTIGHMQSWLFTQAANDDTLSQAHINLTQELPATIASQDYNISQSSGESSFVEVAGARDVKRETPLVSQRVDMNSLIGKTFWKRLTDGQYYRGEVIFYADPHYTVKYDNGMMEKFQLDDILRAKKPESTPPSSKKRPVETDEIIRSAASTSKAVKFALESLFGSR